MHRFVWFDVLYSTVVVVFVFFSTSVQSNLSCARTLIVCIGRAYMDFCIRRDIGTFAIWQLPLSDCFVHVYVSLFR